MRGGHRYAMQRQLTTQCRTQDQAETKADDRAPEDRTDSPSFPTAFARGPGGAIDRALRDGDAFKARNALYDAEQANSLSAPEVANWKARIAIAEQDFTAARAILVSAIETYPPAASLRPLLNEVLIAVGNAAYARDVQAHLGQPSPEADPGERQGTG